MLLTEVHVHAVSGALDVRRPALLAEVTGERNAYRFHFGPANVAAWSLAIAVELERGPSVAETLDASPEMFAALNSADRAHPDPQQPDRPGPDADTGSACSTPRLGAGQSAQPLRHHGSALANCKLESISPHPPGSASKSPGRPGCQGPGRPAVANAIRQLAPFPVTRPSLPPREHGP